MFTAHRILTQGYAQKETRVTSRMISFQIQPECKEYILPAARVCTGGWLLSSLHTAHTEETVLSPSRESHTSTIQPSRRNIRNPEQQGKKGDQTQNRPEDLRPMPESRLAICLRMKCTISLPTRSSNHVCSGYSEKDISPRYCMSRNLKNDCRRGE